MFGGDAESVYQGWNGKLIRVSFVMDSKKKGNDDASCSVK